MVFIRGRSPSRVLEARGGSRPGVDGSQGGMQREKRKGGSYTVSGNVSQVWEVSGADAASVRQRGGSRLRGLILWRERVSCCSAMAARWPVRERAGGQRRGVGVLESSAECVRVSPNGRSWCDTTVHAQWPSRAPNAGSMASSATWSACRAKVPGQDALRAAIQGRGSCTLRSRPRAVALRRARPPRRREGLFVCVRV